MSVLVVVAALGGCTDQGGGDVGSQNAYIPRLVYPQRVYVHEGDSTTFVVKLNDTRGGNGIIRQNNGAVTVVPDTFSLSPTSPCETFTITAAVDTDGSDGPDEFSAMELHIYDSTDGDSPVIHLYVQEPAAPHILPEGSCS